MGWCHAFGPQIHDGCDQAMVADHDRCACAQCGATCYGLFPGCASVWAAGPRRVAITRPAREVGNLLPATTPVLPLESGADAPAGAVPATLASSEQSELRALRVDMQVLLWKFDQLQQGPPADKAVLEAAQQLQAATEALPRQLQQAVTVALETQRRATRKMMAEIGERILADIGQLQSSLRDERRAANPAVGPPGASVADLDSRFQWLVDAVSERFITLGNEIARMQRLLEVDQTAGANGSAAHAAPGNGTGHSGAGSNGAGSNGAGHTSASSRGGPVVGTTKRGPRHDQAPGQETPWPPVAVSGDETRP